MPGARETLSVSAGIAWVMLHHRHHPPVRGVFLAPAYVPFWGAVALECHLPGGKGEGEMVNHGLVFKGICLEETQLLLCTFHWCK